MVPDMVRMVSCLGVMLSFLAKMGQAQVRFLDHFEPHAMRLDLLHVGTPDRDEYALDSVRWEPYWGGPYAHLAEMPDLGVHRVSVFDAKTGKLLYRQGYASLFAEWQTTGEKLCRAMEEVVRFPWPKMPVDVVIEARKKDGTWREAWRMGVDPAACMIDHSVTGFDTKVLELAVNGPPDATVDILILGDGYTDAEDEKFSRDARRFARILFETAPYRDLKDRISVRAVRAPSRQSGVDEPRRGRFVDTGLSVTFNTFDSARYMSTTRMRTLRDLAALAPYDAIMVMANTSRYGGGGIFGQYAIFPSDNEFDEYVFTHEFGHAFAGLADEYYSSSVAYSDFYPRGVEPWEPNITALLPGQPLKWAKYLTRGVPIPTPNDPKYASVVGVFEGAGYSAKGLFRPALDCKMFSKSNVGFCPVCQGAIRDLILLLSDR